MTRAAKNRVPIAPRKAFAYFVSKCASGCGKELIEQGLTDVQACNAVIHMLLDFAAGEACRIARRDGRKPSIKKWREATKTAFEAAVERTLAK